VRCVVLATTRQPLVSLSSRWDDAGPRDRRRCRSIPGAMMQQCVDKRVFLVAGGGMHDESGGLVEHEQGFGPRTKCRAAFLRLRLGGPRLRPVNFNLLARARRVRGFGGLAIDADVALFDEPLQRAARGGGEFCRRKTSSRPPGSDWTMVKFSVRI